MEQTISTSRIKGLYILYMQSHWEVTASMLTNIPANNCFFFKKKNGKKGNAE
jgi:hypothetical protein